jgi:HD-GYP domain-containing protein (c-di-GMP phosphodiesterase class II)
MKASDTIGSRSVDEIADGEAEEDDDTPRVLAALDAARTATLDLTAQAHAAQQEAERLRAELAAALSDCAHWRGRCRQTEQEALTWQSRAQVARERGDNLHGQLLDLHQDLRATDLPTLILRLCLTLTGAEQGVYTGADGEDVLADIGMGDLEHLSTDAFLAFARESARTQEPLVRNDSDTLPDGPEMVNLAAVPVALRGRPGGVILVANKRSGPFTDEDTHALLAVGRHAGVALENKCLHAELNEAYVSTVAVLADAIKAKDPYTRGHCEDVSALAVRVAERLGVDGDALEQVRYAALLHDVGKIGVPDGILLKPGKLTAEERLVIEQHTRIGGDLVARVAGLVGIAPLVRHHHERIDGGGYPDGLSGESIPLVARIIAVVDALDAMTSPRPYRGAMPREDALAELRRCAGNQFDARIVAVVEELLAEDTMGAGDSTR